MSKGSSNFHGNGGSMAGLPGSGTPAVLGDGTRTHPYHWWYLV